MYWGLSYLEWFSSLFACTLNFRISRFFLSSLLVDVPLLEGTKLNFGVMYLFVLCNLL